MPTTYYHPVRQAFVLAFSPSESSVPTVHDSSNVDNAIQKYTAEQLSSNLIFFNNWDKTLLSLISSRAGFDHRWICWKVANITGSSTLISGTSPSLDSYVRSKSSNNQDSTFLLKHFHSYSSTQSQYGGLRVGSLFPPRIHKHHNNSSYVMTPFTSVCVLYCSN